MSHDRGCFRCHEDHPQHHAKVCTIADCPYKDEVQTYYHVQKTVPGVAIEAKQKLRFSWQTVNDAIEALAYMVAPSSPKLIVGVSRGGLIPATLLSHRLNVPLRTISVSAYEGTRRTLEKPLVVDGWETRYDSNDTLIVDDILDSGDTIRAICNHTHRAHYAVLVTKQLHNILYNGVKHFAHVPKDVWVQFPWEQDEQ